MTTNTQDTAEVVARLLSAAAERRVILIPDKSQLHIIARANVPAELLDTLRTFEAEILATLRGATPARQ